MNLIPFRRLGGHVPPLEGITKVTLQLHKTAYYVRLSGIQYWCINLMPDDVIKWKHFPRYWPFVRGIHRSPVNYPHKGQWRGVLMFSLICTRINGWVNNGEAGDLRRYRGHCDVIVMSGTEWMNKFPVYLKLPQRRSFVDPTPSSTFNLHYVPVTPYSSKYIGNTGSWNDLLPDSTKPLPEPVSNCDQWSGPTYRGQVVNSRHQTPQGQSVAKPGTPL